MSGLPVCRSSKVPMGPGVAIPRWSVPSRQPPRATDLAGFLLPTDRMDGSLIQTIERLQGVSGVPRVPAVASGAQIITFLSHTWERAASSPRSLPDEDSVKNVMPRAYGYLLEDLDRDEIRPGAAL
jgi:hypothetical protein